MFDGVAGALLVVLLGPLLPVVRQGPVFISVLQAPALAAIDATVTVGNHALADLLRLVAVPAFAWAAYRDVRTRRVTNRLWPPLVAIGLLALALETVAHWPFAGLGDRLFLVRVAVSLLFVAPLGYLFWRMGAFGGADAKALIVLAVLFPTYPVYFVPGLPVALPAIETRLGVFSLTVLTDAVLVGAAFPVALAIRNALVGRVSPAMLVARVVAVDDLPATHGRLFEDREGFTRGGLDLDALRMYLRWRGTSLAALRADPDGHRDPDSVGETHPPTDGAVHVAGVAVAGNGGTSAAEGFLAEIEGSAYGTDPATLREGLETVVAADRVWVSPGLPFVVPLFLGLLVALTVGDVLFWLLSAVGVA